MKKRKKYEDFQSVGTILPRALKNLIKTPEYKLHLIKFYWEDIVGKDIADHAEPRNFAFGILYIGTSSSVWANNLLYMKFDIINKINNALKYKLVKNINFTYGKKGSNKILSGKVEEKIDTKKTLAKIQLSQQDINVVEEKCNQIKDKDLAKSIKKALLTKEKVNKLKLYAHWHKCAHCEALCPAEEKYCASCTRKLKNKKYDQIRNILMTKPWARFSEIKNYIDGCSAKMVNEVRQRLVQKMVVNLNITSYDDIRLQTLVMLYRAMPPEQINEKIVKENIRRLRYDLTYNEMKKLE